MNTPGPTNRYKHHRFPAEVISHTVWLYFRVCLSDRDVEELLFVRGVIVSYEAIRHRKFGQQYANQFRRWRPRSGEEWHLNEVFLAIHGERHSLWRRWIKTATPWIFWSNVGGTRTPPRHASGSSSRAYRTCRA
jgi:transposase-like protein